jgi:Protein of unknown function (DUF2934)
MPEREIEQDELDRQQKEIALIAYSYWQSRGCPDGHDVEDWLMAEQEVLSRRAPKREEYRRGARTAA